MAFVYALAEPAGGIRYIGATMHSPLGRKDFHTSSRASSRVSQWVASLTSNARLVILEEPDTSRLSCREAYWIAVAVAAGCDLLNNRITKAQDIITTHRDTFNAALVVAGLPSLPQRLPYPFLVGADEIAALEADILASGFSLKKIVKQTGMSNRGGFANMRRRGRVTPEVFQRFADALAALKHERANLISISSSTTPPAKETANG